MTQEQRQALARRVRGEMERQNLDNVRLARKAGVSEKTVSRIINAKLAPRYSTVERLSKALGVNDPDLWDGLGRIEAAVERPVDTPDLAAALGGSSESQFDRIEQMYAQILANQAAFEGIIEQLDRVEGDIGSLYAIVSRLFAERYLVAATPRAIERARQRLDADSPSRAA